MFLINIKWHRQCYLIGKGNNSHTVNTHELFAPICHSKYHCDHMMRHSLSLRHVWTYQTMFLIWTIII